MDRRTGLAVSLALTLVVAAALGGCSTVLDEEAALRTAAAKLGATEAARPISPTPLATFTPLPPLSLNSVFTPHSLSQLHLDPQHLRTLIATGDVIPARHTDIVIRERKDDFIYPVAATKDILSAGDITVVNLEAPLLGYCQAQDSGFTFCGRPGFTAALKASGVKVVTLENNHIGNYGPSGVAETKKHLEAAGIGWADRDTPANVDVRGARFGLVAFNGVGGHIDRSLMADRLRVLRPKVDVLVVAIHWGAEYVSVPQAAPGIADDNPVEIAHLAIEAGADLIIGNHPHWIQAVELYKGKFIAYAHGNFIFDQMWSDETRTGVIGRYTFYDRTLVGVEFIPIQIQNFAQPVPLEGKAAQAVLEGMKSASLELARKLTLAK